MSKSLKILVNDRYENRKLISEINSNMNQIISKLNRASLTSDQKSRLNKLTKEYNNLK